MICRSNDTPCWIYGTGYRVVIDDGASCAVDDAPMAGKMPLADGYSLASMTSVVDNVPASASPLPRIDAPDVYPEWVPDEPYSPYAPLVPLIYYPGPGDPAPDLEIHQPGTPDPLQPAPVPVPASAALIVVAIAALMVVKFRRPTV